MNRLMVIETFMEKSGLDLMSGEKEDLVFSPEEKKYNVGESKSISNKIR